MSTTLNSAEPPSPDVPLEAISEAPDAPPDAPSGADLLDILASQNAALRTQNEQLKAELERLEASAEAQKTALIRPYAYRVYHFLVGYCVAVFATLLLAGFRFRGFTLPEAVLGIVAGSTAVSAIGLVGIVVRGLFGAGAK